MFKKKFLIIFLVLIQAFFVIPAFSAEADAKIDLTAGSAVLMEAETGKVIYEKNPNEAYEPASITKIMTLLLIYEAVESGKIKWDDAVTVSPHAASMGGSQVFLEEGEQQTVETMTKCIAVSSANDAAVAMAEFIAGSEGAFVEQMNSRAKELGMKNTNFINACGLDVEGHVTSAYDIALMSRELTENYPEVFEITGIWQDTIIHKTRKGETEFGLTNTNKLIKWYSGATGLKTGFTSKALYCLSGTAERDGMRLISVVMYVPEHKTRFQEVMKLLDYGFANYTVKRGVIPGEVLGKVEVEKGKKTSVPYTVASSMPVLMKKGESIEIEQKIEISEYIKAPFEAGEKAGEIIYSVSGEEVGRVDLVTTEAVEKAGIRDIVARIFFEWLA